MAPDEKKEPSTPYGEPDKDMERDKKNPKTGESSAPYGVEDETPSTNPAKKQSSYTQAEDRRRAGSGSNAGLQAAARPAARAPRLMRFRIGPA